MKSLLAFSLALLAVSCHPSSSSGDGPDPMPPNDPDGPLPFSGTITYSDDLYSSQTNLVDAQPRLTLPSCPVSEMIGAGFPEPSLTPGSDSGIVISVPFDSEGTFTLFSECRFIAGSTPTRTFNTEVSGIFAAGIVEVTEVTENTLSGTYSFTTQDLVTGNTFSGFGEFTNIPRFDNAASAVSLPQHPEWLGEDASALDFEYTTWR